MSIQSEITRISGNVTNALAAIASKGVTVPSSANSDSLADLISLINAEYLFNFVNNDGNLVVTSSAAIWSGGEY